MYLAAFQPIDLPAVEGFAFKDSESAKLHARVLTFYASLKRWPVTIRLTEDGQYAVVVVVCFESELNIEAEKSIYALFDDVASIYDIPEDAAQECILEHVANGGRSLWFDLPTTKPPLGP